MICYDPGMIATETDLERLVRRMVTAEKIPVDTPDAVLYLARCYQETAEAALSLVLKEEACLKSG